MTMPKTDSLIDELAGSIQPVRPISPSEGRWLIAGAAAVTVIVVALIAGLRDDLAAMRPHAMLLLSSGLFSLLGAAGGWSLTRMARPAVGASSGGWRWALAAVLLLPAAAAVQALVLVVQRGGLALDNGLDCLAIGVAASLGAMALLTRWLRRGAPVAIETAAWLVGLTAGAIGAVAVALICPHDTITHIGLWHAAIPLVMGIAGRTVLPRTLRW